MVATANSSFIEGSDYANRRDGLFFWTMVAAVALDIILLFWLINPLGRHSDELPVSRLSPAQVRATLGDATAKRSPLGTVAPVATKGSRARSNAATLAYNTR